MPGYEDLTADQIVWIANLISASVILYSIALIVRTLFLYKAVKKLEGKVEKIVLSSISGEPKSLKQRLKDFREYREKRKQQKEEKVYARF